MKRLFWLLGGMCLVACSSADPVYPLPIGTPATAANTPPEAWVRYCNWLMQCAPAPFARTFPDGKCAEGYAANPALSSDCATQAARSTCPPETNDVPRTCEVAPPDAGATPDAGAIADSATDGG